MIAESEKKRHELGDGRIRALYGHSTEQEVVKTAERRRRCCITAPRRRASR
jgi:putative RNA 2'-phosphotransferase